MGGLMLVFSNGTFIPPATPVVLATDRGILTGEGVFETCLVQSGVTFALSRHLHRLKRGSEVLGLPPPDLDAISTYVGIVEREWEKSGNLRGRLRITWTAGADQADSPPVDEPSMTRVDAGSRSGTLLITVGVASPQVSAKVHLSRWCRNEHSPLVGVKATSYAENIVALRLARMEGADEAVMANTGGDLCEGTMSNVFVEMDGEIHTPPLHSGCLPGITREVLIEWGSEAGIPVKETTMPLDVMLNTSHAALSSSLKGLIPVSAINDRPLVCGPLTRKLAKIYRERQNDDHNP